MPELENVCEVENSPFENVEGEELDFDEQMENLLNSPVNILSQEETNAPQGESFTEEQKMCSALVSDLDLGQKQGIPVQEKLANMVKSICSQKLIWDQLNSQTRSQDVNLQKIQASNIKAMTALTVLINDILSNKSGLNKENALKRLTDALALLGTANIEFNHFRRDLIRPHLKQEYTNLCFKLTPLSTSLFGDDIGKQVRDLTEANKMSKRIAPYPLRGRGSAFRGASRGRGRRYANRYTPYLRHGNKPPFKQKPKYSQNKNKRLVQFWI